MRKNLLLIFLSLAMLIDAALAGIAFVNPAKALELFEVGYNNDTAFLAYIIAWFCLLFSSLCALAVILLKNEIPGYRPLIFVIGCWSIGIGIGIYIVFKKTDNLFLDSLKGLIIVILNYFDSKKPPGGIQSSKK